MKIENKKPYFSESAQLSTADNHCRGIRCFLAQIYPTEQPKKFNAKIIRVGIWSEPCNGNVTRLMELHSVAARLLLIVLQRYDLQCVFVQQDFHQKLLAGDFDIHGESMTVFPNSVYRFTYPVQEDNMVAVLRKAAPEQQSITQSWSPGVWAAVVVSIAAFVLALWMSGKSRAVGLDTWRTFIVGSFVEERERPLVNALALLLSAFGVIMTTAFCARFMSFLAVGREAPQPQTLAEVAERVDRVYVHNTFIPGVKHYDVDDPVRKLATKVPYGWTYDSAFLDVASSLKAVFLMSEGVFQFSRLRQVFVDQNTSRSLLHAVPQAVLSPSYDVFVGRRDWPMFEYVDKALQHLIESGFAVKLSRDTPKQLWRSRDRRAAARGAARAGVASPAAAANDPWRRRFARVPCLRGGAGGGLEAPAEAKEPPRAPSLEPAPRGHQHAKTLLLDGLGITSLHSNHHSHKNNVQLSYDTPIQLFIYVI